MSFRVLSYNLLEGFRSHPERKAAALNWIAQLNPDVAALQEMNGYSAKSLAEEALQWHHSHALLLKPDGYPTALTSRASISHIYSAQEGFQHGLLKARVAGIDFFVVHLSPWSADERRREAALIVARVQESLRTGQPTLVLGDFNALSPADAGYYAKHSDVRDFLSRMDGPHPSGFVCANTVGGELDFSVLESFGAAGLVDLVARKTKSARERLSFPTPLIEAASTDDYLRRSMRLDYILASPDLARRCHSAKIVNDESTARLSDHYPVVAEFEL